ncbi:MAG TPA: aldehyde dehydrogenase family protein [Vicinamibacterales bacterium]|nr:aldehyde dehydrogenase family protein [Vicinamibacterales bacterium]
MTEYLHHFIGGDWRPSTARDATDVVSSATEQVIGRVPRGTAADVDAAVAAARAAFDGAWGRTTVEARAQWLERLATAMQARVPEMATAIAHEVGTAVGYATKVQVEFPIAMIAANATFIREARLEEELGNSLVVKEPVGIVGCITPWNYPLHQVVCKVAPALAAGCTVVLKPAELAPLSAFVLAEAILEIGLPAGVINIVSGDGRVVGEAISAHPGLDMVSFTGSLEAGRRVAAVAGDGIKKVCLELGGKSAFIVLDDAPFEKAVPAGVNHCMQNSGQTCSAWTRMLVPRARYAEAIELAVAQLAKLTVGDPFDPATRLGPLVSAAHRERVLGYIAQGQAEGARIVVGGGRPPTLPTGFYVSPTIFADVDNAMTIAQEEIFGPVLAMIPYDAEDDAVRIANDSPYGLAGGVWAGSTERAMAVARRMRTGQVDINGGRFNVLAPFGGCKKSGLGREIGPLALDEFFTRKSIQR